MISITWDRWVCVSIGVNVTTCISILENLMEMKYSFIFLLNWIYDGLIPCLISDHSHGFRHKISNNDTALMVTNVCKTCPDGQTDLMVVQCNASNAHGYAYASGYLNVLCEWFAHFLAQWCHAICCRTLLISRSLAWRYNGRDGVSNHQPHDCSLNRLFRRRSNKASMLRVTGLCAGNSLVTGEFSAQIVSNAEIFPFHDVSMDR